ncbi:hypothetical protein FOVSG1_013846 [Fusarium oxysporum f. sp. vasinfectum]
MTSRSSAELFDTRDGWEDVNNTQADCQLQRDVSQCVQLYGFDGKGGHETKHGQKTYFRNKTLDWPPLNVKALYLPTPFYWNWTANFTGMASSTPLNPYRHSSELTFLVEDESGESVEYQWGCSFLQLFVMTVLLHSWSIGLVVLWTTVHLTLKRNNIASSPEGWKSLLKMTDGIKEQLMSAGMIWENLTDKELQGEIRLLLTGGPVPLSSEESHPEKALPQGHFSLWRWMWKHKLRLLEAFAGHVQCSSDFITPELSSAPWSENQVYEVDDEFEIKWKTDHKGCNLFLWQDYPKLAVEWYSKLLENTTETSYVWNASSSGFSQESEDTVFHFALYSSDKDVPLANSGSFNISGTNSSKLKATSVSNSTPASTASQASETSTGSSETTHHSATNSENDPGLSTAALVGISVGVTVAGLLISGGVGLCLWRRFTRKRTTERVDSIEKSDFTKAELGNAQILQIGSSELDSTRDAAELWDTQKPGELGDENKIRTIYGLHEAP